MRPIASFKTFLFLISATFAIAACSGSSGGGGGNSNGRISPTYEGPAELVYCSTPIIHSSPVTITGTATYQAREVFGVPGNGGLGNPGTAKPIRYAEVRVTTATGAVAQCAETDAAGNFSVDLPNNGITYTISVNARGDNSMVNATIFDAPETNSLYSLTTSVVADGSKSVGTINAPADNTVLGAPFNIFDQIVAANDYLRAQLGNCSATVTNCVNFTVAPKVKAYWEFGFNPGSYFNTGGLSFYLPGFSRLFILGGVNGDVNNTDTDHFDNSIILHEYGHFLEDIFSNTDSPGGSHSGNAIIDPRLALGEGWGNFFQAAALNAPGESAPRYTDTIGNIDGSTDFIFRIDLEAPDGSCTPSVPGCDEPILPSEGNFREFAIARFLWDAIDTVNDGETITSGFPEIWAAITAGNGYLNTNAEFRSIGYLHSLQDGLLPGNPVTDWDPLRSHVDLKQVKDRTEFALYVDDTGACGAQNFTIIPYDFVGDNEKFNTSHLLRNNDFLHYSHPTTSNLTLTLNYTTPVGAEADLDLYLYDINARLGEQPSGVSRNILTQSESEPSGGSGDVETEALTVTNLPAGDYLINVYVYTLGPAVGASTNYEVLGNGGTRICPTALP